MILPSSSCGHITTLNPENVKQRLRKMSVAVNVIVLTEVVVGLYNVI